MALLLKKVVESYTYYIEDLSDPRANDYFILRSPIPSFVILILWYKFVFKWGPEYMKDKEPLDIKKIIMVYNIVQILANLYLAVFTIMALDVVSFTCTPVDYSESYWGRTFLHLSHLYHVLKLLDLLDTVFFVLRKKTKHISFLHTYHHAMMVIVTWFGCKFIGGGHSYFLGLANSIVHTILYSYYLLTAYDSKYVRIIWLKKLITQIQILQFLFLLSIALAVFSVKDCPFPKLAMGLLIPQNLIMLVLFIDFYVKTYISEPKKRRKIVEQLNGKEKIGQVSDVSAYDDTAKRL